MCECLFVCVCVCVCVCLCACVCLSVWLAVRVCMRESERSSQKNNNKRTVSVCVVDTGGAAVACVVCSSRRTVPSDAVLTYVLNVKS